MKNNFIDIVCPICQGELSSDSDGMFCRSCETIFRSSENGFVDFRQLLKSGDWDSELFDTLYSNSESGFEDNYKHAERGGIPSFIEDYRYSRKGASIERKIYDLTPGTVLDIGCGYGWFCCKLKERLSETSFAVVDVSPSKLSLFNEKNRQNKSDMIATLANAGNLPFEGNSFDIILLNEVIEHLPDPEKCLAECYRVLKPGGTLFLTTPSRFMRKFWKLTAIIPTFIKRIFNKENIRKDENRVYDVPLNCRTLKSIIMGNSFEVTEWGKVILLPHESYLQFIPEVLLRIILFIAKVCEIIGFTCFGLHHMIVINKKNEK